MRDGRNLHYPGGDLSPGTHLLLVLFHEVGKLASQSFAPPAQLHDVETPFAPFKFTDVGLRFVEPGS
jgi:hypothetical protein